MRALYLKELKSYFSSPIGFVILSIVGVVSSVFFVVSNLMVQTADMSQFFPMFLFIMVVVVSLITMRLWSDEKAKKTDQLLLTAPVGLFSITLGKYLAALTLYGMGMIFPLIYAFILASFGKLDVMVFIGNIFGLMLVGAALVALGMFISNLTESQIIAAVIMLAVVLLLGLVGIISQFTQNTVMLTVLSWISFFSRYDDFSVGLLNYADIIYYLSFAAIFLFMTVRFLERRRWN